MKQIVDEHAETGSLLHLTAELMRSEATMNKDLDISKLVTAFGRFFQIRDDCKNLDSAEVRSSSQRLYPRDANRDIVLGPERVLR